MSITYQIGTTSGGAAHDLEDAMRAQGFGDTSPAFIGGPVQHPFSNTGLGAIGTPQSLGFQYRIRQPWSVGVVVSSAPIGETLGYHDPFQFIAIDHAVRSYGVTASAAFRILRVGIGPAVHVARARTSGPWESHIKFGFIAEAGLRLPTRSRFFFDVGLQYRYAGSVTLSPITSSGITGQTSTFSPSNVRFNHWFIGVGPGVRF
jgi:hypothetical protein